MNKFSNRLTNAHSRLLDAEATLHYLNDRENLNTILEQGCPDVVLGALIAHIDNLVGDACEDCELMKETHNDDFLAELKQSAGEARDHMAKFRKDGAPVEEVASSKSRDYLQHIDKINEIHEQSLSMLAMLIAHCGQANEDGEALNHSLLESYAWQLQSNIERAAESSFSLEESLK